MLAAWLISLAGPMVGVHAETTPEEALGEASRAEAAGEFAVADRALAAAQAAAGLDPVARSRLEWERERLRRIRRDYRLDRAGMLERLRRGVRDFAEPELDRWAEAGWIDRRILDGVERYFVSGAANLFFRRPEMEARRLGKRPGAEAQRGYHENAMAIRDAARRMGRPYVLPKRFSVRMRLTVEGGTARPGEEVRAWLPVPRRYPFQSGFELVRSSPPGGDLAAEEAAMRSIFLRQPADAGGGAVFEITYRYTAHGVWFDLQPGASRAGGTHAPEFVRFLGEAPHVRFTPAMRELAERLAGSETNAVLRVRRYFQWIAAHVRYSYAPEYSTVPDLAESCRASLRGDCGQATLLFMTLCRIGGVPARWQSGWAIFPGDETIHDWCEIHLEPWGWVPVDPYMGVYAMQHATGLGPDEREQLRDFYLGGLTQYRMIANADHQQALWPAKAGLRSDPVDFQRGEVEAGGRNVYFDRFDYSLDWEELP